LLAKNFPDVPLLDFHTEKFQLRGISPTRKTSLAKASAKNIKKIFFSQELEKLIPITEMERASSRNNPEHSVLSGSPSPVTTLL